MNSNDTPILLFLHIPKAAGSTLMDVIHQNVAPDSIFKIRHPRPQSLSVLRGMSAKKKNGMRVVAGHMPFGWHSHFDQECRYVTLLRNPITRAVSYYDYVLRTPRHYLHDAVTSSKMSLERFIESGLTVEMDNGQTRLLSGDQDECATPLGRVSQSMLSAAKEHLEQYFSVVGITEHFDESLLLMQREFNWKNIKYESKNVGSRHVREDGISANTRRAIGERNSYDMALYDWAKSRFRSSIQKQGFLFQLQRRLFTYKNSCQKHAGNI